MENISPSDSVRMHRGNFSLFPLGTWTEREKSTRKEESEARDRTSRPPPPLPPPFSHQSNPERRPVRTNSNRSIERRRTLPSGFHSLQCGCRSLVNVSSSWSSSEENEEPLVPIRTWRCDQSDQLDWVRRSRRGSVAMLAKKLSCPPRVMAGRTSGMRR